MTPTDPAGVVTVQLVELAELLQLARLGYEMRRAQRRYVEARKKAPHSGCADDLVAARSAEALFDKAVAAALHRERTSLPGMEGGG